MSLTTAAQQIVDRIRAKRANGDRPYDHSTDRILLLAEIADIADGITGGGGTWGGITGTLSNQTDLQNALNLKSNALNGTHTGTTQVETLNASLGADIAGTLNILATTAWSTSVAFSYGANSAANHRTALGSDNADNLTSGTVGIARLVNTQTVGNADATVTAGKRDVLLTAALTAPRTFTWPLASAYPAGARVSFVDIANTLTAANTATLARSGSDLLNGATSIVLSTAGASPFLISDGVSKWNLDIRGISRGGTGATTAAAAAVAIVNGNPINPSTIGATTPGTGAFTSGTFTLSWKSTTALATPSALSATEANFYASTVSGASLGGFGTTNDVTLRNRAGTVCLGVGPNTTAINIPGTLAVTGASTMAAITSTQLALGTVTADGVLITNTTFALDLTRVQISPALSLNGSGWATTPGSSMAVKFSQYVVPVTGISSPTGKLTWDSSVGTAPAVTQMTLDTAGALAGLTSVSAALYYGSGTAGGLLRMDGNTSARGLGIGSLAQIAWSSGAYSGGTVTGDTSLSRNAAGIVQIGTTTTNALGSLLLTNLTASGTLGVTGVSTLTGGATLPYVTPGINVAQLRFVPLTGNGVNFNVESNGSAISVRNNADSSSSLCIRSVSLDMASNGLIKWTNASSNALTTIDTGIGRTSAGLVEINSGTLGTLRDLSLRNLTSSGTLLTGDGTVSAPAYSFTSASGIGMYLASSIIRMTTGSVDSVQFAQNMTGGVNIRTANGIGFGATSAVADAIIGRQAAANIRQGSTDAATAVAQTSSVQSVVAGTSNTAGANRTYSGSQGTGSGVGGAHIFQVAPAGAAATVQNTLVDALTITGKGGINLYTTTTAGGITGNVTIDKPTGTVNIAAAGASVTVTNALVSATSTVFAVIRTNDTTALIKNVVPGAGSFVINLNAATTAETSIGFFVINP